MAEIERLLDAELVDHEVMHDVAHVLHGPRRALVEIAGSGHAVMRQVGHDHAQAAAQRVLHDVAVVPAERTLAMDDDEHLRILVGAGIFVHVADLPGRAVAVLRVGVFHRIGIGDVILPERLVRIDIRGHAGHAIVLVDELLRPVEARDVIHERDELRIVLAVVDDREHAVMRDRAFLGDQVGARNAVDGAFGELEVQPQVVGDVHHQRAGPDAAEIGIDVVGLADAVAPDEVDRVVELGAVDHVHAGLLVRRIPVEDFRLHRRESSAWCGRRSHSRSSRAPTSRTPCPARGCFSLGSL